MNDKLLSVFAIRTIGKGNNVIIVKHRTRHNMLTFQCFTKYDNNIYSISVGII